MKAATVQMRNDAATAEELAQRRFALMTGQVASLRWSFMLVMLAMAAVSWVAAPAILVASWLLAALLTHVLRVRSFVLHAARDNEAASIKIRLGVAWNLALGLVYGASSVFMFWLDLPLSAVLTMIVVSAAAGAVAISGPLLPVYGAYAVGLMLPFALSWALKGGVLGLGLAALMLVFMAMQYRFATQVSATFTESFLIRQQNQELVQQLTLARDEANAASHAKTRFLAAASHDLRQPLHALALQSAALSVDLQAPDSPAIAAAIARSVDDLSSLLDSLLDISKLDAGVLMAQSRPIYLSRLIENLARSMRPLIEGKGLSLKLVAEPHLVVNSDPVLIERTLRNLLDNAIKFTEHGGIVLALERQGEWAHMSVVDSGTGIPLELQSKVFEEFYQIDPFSKGPTQGLGLGLSIVRRLTSLLGARLELQSEPGQGTAVNLFLPLASTMPAVPADTEESDVVRAGMKVLVLDDEPKIRVAMANLLRRLDCHVSVAADVTQAQALLEGGCFDLMLIDYGLGDGENGLQAQARLRVGRPNLRVVMITGETTAELLRAAHAEGLAVLHKPVTLKKMRQLLSAEKAS